MNSVKFSRTNSLKRRHALSIRPLIAMSIQFPFLRWQRDEEYASLAEQLETGDYASVLSSPTAVSLFSYSASPETTDHHSSWSVQVKRNTQHLAQQSDRARHTLFAIGLASFQAFLQSNVTGPPLDFHPAALCFPSLADNKTGIRQRQRQLVPELSVDGEAIYALTPHVELFVTAKVLLNDASLAPSSDAGAWARLRVNFWHQKMLNEIAPGLQDSIYADIAYLEGFVLGETSSYSAHDQALYLLERAAIHTFHGFDKRARDDLEVASRLRGFEHVLTGRLGKRTKFQQNDLSQLVVLARSRESNIAPVVNGSGLEEYASSEKGGTLDAPKETELNDDTLLERISFASSTPAAEEGVSGIASSLAQLDPSAQPILDSADATILLSYASSITNTSPDNGLTREETLPYATRVIDGGSSNWQVYTQALLVRSRIEGYKSRTVERGVLQLQALVDQVIAETSEGGASNGATGGEQGATTFLPRAKPSESAPVSERLKYIHQLSTPPRWALEAELASRWASLGGLRTALDIYERLEMWAEASLCLAATDDEKKAIRMVRKQLFHPITTTNSDVAEQGSEAVEVYEGPELDPLPADAPRLFCILGDLENNPSYWDQAWTISNHRYARAQRTLGKYYLRDGQLPKADEAYAKSLSVSPQNAATWFSLGCVRLELRRWRGAVTAFQRSVQLEDEDGEAWSNLAAALLHLPPDDDDVVDVSQTSSTALPSGAMDDEDGPTAVKCDPQKHKRQAFVAFKRAATLKRDSFRIWQNLLNVGATLVPPPYTDIIVAQTRIIELRKGTEGEGCVDIEVLEGLLQHILATTPTNANIGSSATQDYGAAEPKPRHGLIRMFATLLNTHVIPLITHSRRLWQLVARFALHENKPSTALDAYEKAWRTTLNQPGWDDGAAVASGASGTSSGADSANGAAANAWQAVLDATDELVSAYESLGEREVTEGLKAGSAELVCRNWRFKARSAIRSVVGRRVKAGIEGEDVEMLRARMEELKG